MSETLVNLKALKMDEAQFFQFSLFAGQVDIEVVSKVRQEYVSCSSSLPSFVAFLCRHDEPPHVVYMD